MLHREDFVVLEYFYEKDSARMRSLMAVNYSGPVCGTKYVLNIHRLLYSASPLPISTLFSLGYFSYNQLLGLRRSLKDVQAHSLRLRGGGCFDGV